MKAKFAGVSIAVVLLVGAAQSARAHHGFTIEFDPTRCMDLTETLTGLEWDNPHAYFRMDVKAADGKMVPWRLEMITPNALKRNGTTSEDFAANMNKPMHVRACPAREGAGQNRGAAEYIKLADGLIRIVGQVVERDLTPEKLSFWN
jgi:Family of unknown function (DUF6152)